jgi:glycerate-2-kinase
VETFRDLPQLDVLVLAGETTVVVRGDGSGGRNQEAALAAALALDGSDDVAFLAAGTDGIDGPTPAAGGVVDGTSVERGRTIGLDATRALENNDSGSWLDAVGARLVTGPTGTNVGDLWIVVRTSALHGGIA